MEVKRPVKDLEEFVMDLAGGAAARWILLTGTAVLFLVLSLWGLLTGRDFFAAVAIGPAFITLLLSLKAATIMSSVSRMSQRLSVLVFSTQMQLARELLRLAPAGSSKLVFMKVAEGPVELYRPIQWWRDDSMIVGAGKDVWTRFPAYREMLSEWIVKEEPDRITVSLILMKKNLRAGILVDQETAGSGSSQWLVDVVNKLAATDPREEDLELTLPA